MSASNESSSVATASGAHTVREADERTVEDGVLHLIVMGANIFAMHPLPEAGRGVDRARRGRRRAHRRPERLAAPRAAARRPGAGDRGPGQHQRHAPARRPADAGAARRGAAGRGDLDRLGDADDPAPPAHRPRAAASRRTPISRAAWRRNATRRRRPGAVFAVVRLHVAPGTSPETVARDRFAAGAAGRRARVVRPRRIRDDCCSSTTASGSPISPALVITSATRGIAARTGIAFFPRRRALRRRPHRPRVRARAGAPRAPPRRRPMTSAAAPRCGACTCSRSAPRRPTSTS